MTSKSNGDEATTSTTTTLNKKNQINGSVLSSSSSSSSSSSIFDTPIPGLNITTAFALWLIVTTAVPLMKYCYRPNLSILSILVLGFNNLNILIAFCEIGLGRNIKYIQQHFKHLEIQTKSPRKSTNIHNNIDAAVAYLCQSMSLRQLLFVDGGKAWCHMWSTYSLYDPSYSSETSFGFFIDVGNGYSTIVPCLIWNLVVLGVPVAVDNDIINPVLVGFIGCCSYWQILYGTIIYGLSFVWNRRYLNNPLPEVLSFVGISNGIWFVFPILALYQCYQLLQTQSYEQVFCDATM